MSGKLNIFLLSIFVGMYSMHAHSWSLTHKQDIDTERNRVEEAGGKMFDNQAGKNIRTGNLPLSTVNTQDNITANFLIFNLRSSNLKKRDISDKSNKPFTDVKSVKEDACKRHTFEIKFKDLGMDFVLHPENVDIGICKGSCTAKDAPIVTSSAELKRLAYTKFNLTSEEVTCCAPITFQPLTVTYQDEDGLVSSGSLNDLIISECGCL